MVLLMCLVQGFPNLVLMKNFTGTESDPVMVIGSTLHFLQEGRKIRRQRVISFHQLSRTY